MPATRILIFLCNYDLPLDWPRRYLRAYEHLFFSFSTPLTGIVCEALEKSS